MIYMICGKTQSIQKIEIFYISRNSTTVFGLVTFLSIFGTLYIYIYKSIYLYMYVCMNVCICMYVYIYIYIYTYMCKMIYV